ncbi:MAG: hypothetical protein SGJ18_16430 [Pseudomonadota bacterium]|nr:hypothetical protein [Pseudomonadota bacterium]
MKRLQGESLFLPNLHIKLSDVQIDEVTFALKKLEGAHHSQVAWVGPYALDGNSLSIHALDLISVLLQCRRTADIELELFRLRKTAVDQIGAMLERAKEEVKIRNLEIWLDSYKKIWPGAESDRNLTQPPPQPARFDLCWVQRNSFRFVS